MYTKCLPNFKKLWTLILKNLFKKYNIYKVKSYLNLIREINYLLSS